jgi:hypothetical protein
MDFDSLDSYLLEERPAKAEIIKSLLEARPGGTAAAAFYQGMEMLGPRTPDLTLIALRLVLAGKAADDESVKHLRSIVERARTKDGGTKAAAQEYREALQ